MLSLNEVCFKMIKQGYLSLPFRSEMVYGCIFLFSSEYSLKYFLSWRFLYVVYFLEDIIGPLHLHLLAETMQTNEPLEVQSGITRCDSFGLASYRANFSQKLWNTLHRRPWHNVDTVVSSHVHFFLSFNKYSSHFILQIAPFNARNLHFHCRRFPSIRLSNLLFTVFSCITQKGIWFLPLSTK